jgi:glycerophosphoryl diester phosphodiesterase
MQKLLRIGHRGARGYVLENTLLSFQKALELGCDGIELDIHLSKDKKLVVIHDDTVDRTTCDTGKVAEMTLLELQKLGIPSLNDVLTLVDKRCFINIEIKANYLFEILNDLIVDAVLNKEWQYKQLFVSCFNHEVLHYMHKLNKNLCIGVLTETNIDEAIQTAQALNAYSVHPDYVLLDNTSCQKIKDAGFKVLPWTVNSLEDIEKMKKLQIDGIMSDFPDKIY